MFRKTIMAGCAALALAAAFTNVAQAQSNSVEWWRANQANGGAKGCVGGEQGASSAYPAWAVCAGRAGSR
jgi:hypothetical protein